MNNTGSITGSGSHVLGVHLVDGNNQITNSGELMTTGNGADGILAQGGSSSVNNSGTIVVTGAGSYAVDLQGGDNQVVNSGTITTSGNTGVGIYATEENNMIVNTGTIATTEGSGDGIHVEDANNTVSNSGTITTQGTSAHGISSDGGGNTITNTGTITTHGASADGIRTEDDNNTVTNSGRIVSDQSNAITFLGAGNTLNLKAFSFLGGGVDLGGGTTVNIDFAPSSSVFWEFSGTVDAMNFTGSVPVFYNAATSQVATFDPTAFSGSSDALADMTDNVSSVIRDRLDCVGDRWWTSVFGSTSKYDGSSATLDFDSSNMGVAIGYDASITESTTLGVLAGYLWNDFDVDSLNAKSFDNKSDGAFLGIYGRQRWSSVFIDLAVTGGWLDHSDDRMVNNNLAASGESEAEASYDSWWFSPEATIGYEFALSDEWSLVPAASLRYARQTMDSYTESGGGDANAHVAGRDVSMLEQRLELGVRGMMDSFSLNVRAGWQYRNALGDDDVELTMLGQNKAVSTEMEDRSALFLAGGVAAHLTDAVSLKLNGEAELGDDSTSIGGSAMVCVLF
ncbi:autotransporter family protein [Desulfovibrio sp. Fe33]|uniref:autotransporter family protein n=1 Tax=Desulfovibrio sp. Fe33 TaxID=3020842 RepID=UPI00234C57C3|nr:autotransporter outer membrane beta-barrel domain-containing protein [Desulfovibrio sp. Fe33]